MSKNKTKDLTKKSTIPVHDWIKQRKTTLNRFKQYVSDPDNDWSRTSLWYTEAMESEYSTEITIVKQTLSELKKYVDKFESYLKHQYSKDFIDTMVKIISISMERNDTYRFVHNFLDLETPEEKQQEVEWQSTLQSDFTKVKETLQKLNLDNEVLAVEIPIHGNKKVPFLMREIIEKEYPEIIGFRKTLLEDMDVRSEVLPDLTPYDVNSSTEMFINMKNPPVYDPRLHYYEQTQEVLDFYSEELYKIRHGVTIAGVYIHGWLYWHMNYFMTDLPMSVFKGTKHYSSSKELLITIPPLRDNEWFFINQYQQAEVQNIGLAAFGTRRFAKTVLEASFMSWRTTVVQSGEASVIGGDDGDLKKLAKTLEIAFKNVHPAFRLTRNSNNWDSHIQFGLKKKNNESIPYTDIFIKNVNGGSGRGTEKAAGASPSAWIADEMGKFNIKTVYEAAIPSFQTADGWRTIPLMVGTGGNPELSMEAQEMLTNPKANRILAMNWDTLDDIIKEEDVVTWKRRNFAVFLPAQMSIITGMTKRRTTLAEFLEVDSEELQKAEIRVTQWKQANEIIDKMREDLKTDRTALNRNKMYHPKDPLECFLNKIDNPFCQNEAMEHSESIRHSGDYGKYVEVYKSPGSDTLKYQLSDKEPAAFPFKGGNVDAPVIMFDDPPEFPVFDGTYVAGLDHYKHDKASTDSIGVLVIYKRNVMVTGYRDEIVCIYASRPDTMDVFNETCELLLEGYGAQCLMEGADISLQKHLQRKNKEHRLLVRGIEVARRMINSSATQNNDYVLNASAKNKNLLLKLVINYANEFIKVGEREDGSSIEVRGVTRIKDLQLLKEMIEFEYGKNTDRIIAFGHTLMLANYFDELGLMPKPKINRESNAYREQQRRDITKHRSPYSTKRYNPITNKYRR